MHIERISYFLKLNKYDSNDINLLMANMNIEQHEWPTGESCEVAVQDYLQAMQWTQWKAYRTYL